ncbi:SURF1 family protein [Streptomyces sp. TLI_171]|uniref:SURF1 family cytochrome oxidase biogenesis protein n=1 Tax=Streptomyces sp. TLI_171 TaxID=1938859 RepID=UPI000C650E4D|nr:SURF1 family protein [Streptomyces sp. TLI_171]RKE21809.1 cytochrome oxidase assembly protein ShyY1 [Streptomyces sp. TLI_171]
MPGVYRFLLSARWAVIALVALLLIPTMVRLGFWQYHRHEARVARNELVARNLGSPPVAFDSLSAPGWSVPTGQVWRTVTAQGHYDTGHEVVVRGRTEPGGSSIGYFVITPLVLADGKGSVLVNRGWVESGADAASLPAVPAPPAGEVTVTGRLRADETYASLGVKNRGGLPERMYKVINSAEQAKFADATVLGGYLELSSSQPAAGAAPQPLAEPGHSDIGPHMAYAVQWWLFASLVPVGLVVMARREARQDGQAPAAADELVGATS